MAEDLERRERQAESVSVERQAKERLQREMERLRKKAEEKEDELFRQKKRQESVHAGKDDRMERTLKVNWLEGRHDVVSLRQMFSEYGDVEDVVMRESKKKRKSALVVMQSKKGFDRVMDGFDHDGEMQVKGLANVPQDGREQQKGSGVGEGVAGAGIASAGLTSAADNVYVEKRTTPLFPAASSSSFARVKRSASSLGGNQTASFEAQVLARMQEASQGKKLEPL